MPWPRPIIRAPHAPAALIRAGARPALAVLALAGLLLAGVFALPAPAAATASATTGTTLTAATTGTGTPTGTNSPAGSPAGTTTTPGADAGTSLSTEVAGDGTATGDTTDAGDTTDTGDTTDAGNARGDEEPAPVILVGTSGLRWDDITGSAVGMNALLTAGAVGVMSVRGAHDVSCPVDGWLTVSTGRRAAAGPGTGCTVPTAAIPEAGGPGTVTGWAGYRAQAARDVYDARPGLLGDTARTGNLRTAAVGPGAVIALAGGDGTAPAAWPGLSPSTTGGVDPTGDASTLADQVRAALDTNPDLLVVDIGALRDPAPGSDEPSRADQVTELDNRLQLVLGLREIPGSATIIVASLADSSTAPHLQLVAGYGTSGTPATRGAGRAGPSFEQALLTSSSTRQPGLVQGRDIQPTLLTALALPLPADAPGAPLQPTDRGGNGPDRLEKVLDLERAAQAAPPVIPVFFAVYGGLIVATLLGGLWAAARLHGPDRRRERTLRALRWWTTSLAAVPVSLFLIGLAPWWRAGTPGLVLAAGVAGLAVTVTALAALGPWRAAPFGPLGAVGAVTMLVLAADVLTGARLELLGLMGQHPLIGGRFYGFGNQGFAVFATGALLAALAGADALRRRGRIRWAVGLVAAVGTAAAVLDGTPGWGSDFGGPVALIIGFTVFGFRVAGARITRWRAVATGAVAVTALVGLSLFDWSRPARNRTHLGRFVQSLIDGGAGPILGRKLGTNLDMLLGPLGLLAAAAAVVVVAALAAPARFRLGSVAEAYRRFPLLRPGLAAAGLIALIGFLGNDSGVGIPVDVSMLVLPLTLVAALRAQELADADRAAAAVRAARRAAKPRTR